MQTYQEAQCALSEWLFEAFTPCLNDGEWLDGKGNFESAGLSSEQSLASSKLVENGLFWLKQHAGKLCQKEQDVSFCILGEDPLGLVVRSAQVVGLFLTL